MVTAIAASLFLIRAEKFLRQRGHQGTKEEADAGVGSAFMPVVHCVVIGNDNLVYVCDLQGDRIQVFDKMGNFKSNIWLKRGNSLPDNWGTTWWIGFSPDREQKYMYVDDGGMSRSRFSTMLAEKCSQALGDLVTRSVNLRAATLWRSIPKAMFIWPRPTGAAESKDSSQ
jgi:hypothetical protein